MAGSEHLGTLVLCPGSGGPDLAESDQLILERAAMVTALLRLRRSVTETQHRVRGELLGPA
jgi:hypothetical protein